MYLSRLRVLCSWRGIYCQAEVKMSVPKGMTQVNAPGVVLVEALQYEIKLSLA